MAERIKVKVQPIRKGAKAYEIEVEAFEGKNGKFYVKNPFNNGQYSYCVYGSMEDYRNPKRYLDFEYISSEEAMKVARHGDPGYFMEIVVMPLEDTGNNTCASIRTNTKGVIVDDMNHVRRQLNIIGCEDLAVKVLEDKKFTPLLDGVRKAWNKKRLKRIKDLETANNNEEKQRRAEGLAETELVTLSATMQERNSQIAYLETMPSGQIVTVTHKPIFL